MAHRKHQLLQLDGKLALCACPRQSSTSWAHPARLSWASCQAHQVSPSFVAQALQLASKACKSTSSCKVSLCLLTKMPPSRCSRQHSRAHSRTHVAHMSQLISLETMTQLQPPTSAAPRTPRTSRPGGKDPLPRIRRPSTINARLAWSM